MRRGGEKIGSCQLVWMLTVTVLGTAFFFLPGAAARAGREDSWLVTVVATAPGGVALYLALRLASMFPGLTIAEYSQKVLGRLAGGLVGFAYGAAVVNIAAMAFREMGEFLATSIMPNTPLPLMVAMTAAVSGYAAAQGLEVIARLCEIIVPPSVATGLAFFALLIPEMELDVFLPVMSGGIGRVLRGSKMPAAWRLELGLLAMIAPQVNRPDRMGRAGLAAIAFLTLFLTIEDLAVVGALGVSEAGRTTFAVFTSGEVVRYGEFLERLDGLVMVVWLAMVFAKAALLVYLGSLAVSQSLGLKDSRPVAWPATFLAAFLAVVEFRDLRDMLSFFERRLLWYTGALGILVPGVLLIVARARGLGGTRR